MISYQKEINALGLSKQEFLGFANITLFKYDRIYKTDIHRRDIHRQVRNFIDYKINNLQEVLKKMDEERNDK
jgi:hypothetical protein